MWWMGHWISLRYYYYYYDYYHDSLLLQTRFPPLPAVSWLPLWARRSRWRGTDCTGTPQDLMWRMGHSINLRYYYYYYYHYHYREDSHPSPPCRGLLCDGHDQGGVGSTQPQRTLRLHLQHLLQLHWPPQVPDGDCRKCLVPPSEGRPGISEHSRNIMVFLILFIDGL